MTNSLTLTNKLTKAQKLEQKLAKQLAAKRLRARKLQIKTTAKATVKEMLDGQDYWQKNGIPEIGQLPISRKDLQAYLEAQMWALPEANYYTTASVCAPLRDNPSILKSFVCFGREDRGENAKIAYQEEIIVFAEFHPGERKFEYGSNQCTTVNYWY